MMLQAAPQTAAATNISGIKQRAAHVREELAHREGAPGPEEELPVAADVPEPDA